MVADVTQVALPPDAYDLWHDRAVFHFLTDPSERAAYLSNLKQALKLNGHLIIATFAHDGPPRCSGLGVERYSIGKMKQTIGGGFDLVHSFREQHQTPFDTMQNFLYAHFRKSSGN